MENQTIETPIAEAPQAEILETPIVETDKPIDPASAKQETTIQARTSSIDIAGKQYQVSEDMLKKFYGIEDNAPLTDREWKTMVSSYKTHTHSNLTNRQAVNIQKQAEDAFKMILDNPKQALTQLFNGNPQKLREFSEQYLLEQLEEETLPEEQKTIRQQQKELEKYKQMIDEQNRVKQESEMSALVETYQKDITGKIINALETNKQLPKNHETIQRIAHYMLKGLERGIEKIEPADVIPLVLEDYQNQIKSLLGESDPENLIKFLGEEQVKKLRQHDLSKVKNLQNGSSRSIENTKHENIKPKSMNEKEFRKMTQERIAMLK